MRKVIFIAAIDDNNGLAKHGKIPWKLPSDIARFEKLTLGKNVLMGAATYQQMSKDYISNRTTFVASRNEIKNTLINPVYDLKNFLDSFNDELWVIGGGQIFTFSLPYADNLDLTRVEGDYSCDTFFPDFDTMFMRAGSSESMQENGTNYRFESWVPKASE